MIEPKTAATTVAGVATGALVGSGILDQPTLLMWLGFGSLAGGLVAMSVWEHESAPGETRSWLSLLGQFFTGLSCGVFATPIVLVHMLPQGPYRAEHVAGISFGVALSAWQVIRLVEPVLKRYGRRWLRSKLEGRADD